MHLKGSWAHYIAQGVALYFVPMLPAGGLVQYLGMVEKKIRPATIGIIGGVGPVAGAAMHSEILRFCQSLYGAAEDTEYPDIMLVARAVSGVGNDGVDVHGNVGHILTRDLSDLLGLGARVVVNACNTTGAAFVELGRALGVQIVDMVGVSVDAVGVEARKVGLLTSRALRDAGTYAGEVERSHREAVVLDDENQSVLDGVIQSLMGGQRSGVDGGLLRVLAYLEGLGAEHIVAGCTELSSVNIGGLTGVPVSDSVVESARVAVQLAYWGIS